MSTGYPSSWPHPITQVIDDTIHAPSRPTAKPGHALARPGHCFEEDTDPSVKVRQHAHVTRSMAQALIARPQHHTGGYESTRQKCHIDSTEAPPP